jgi:hypothetical protein
MAGAKLPKAINHVAEEFVMPTLVGTDRDTVGIFLDGRKNDVIDTAIVAKMHDFNTLRLDQASHYVNRRVVTIK